MGDAREPELIGGYRLGRRLDGGGSAETYQAKGPGGEVAVIVAYDLVAWLLILPMWPIWSWPLGAIKSWRSSPTASLTISRHASGSRRPADPMAPSGPWPGGERNRVTSPPGDPERIPRRWPPGCLRQPGG